MRTTPQAQFDASWLGPKLLNVLGTKPVRLKQNLVPRRSKTSDSQTLAYSREGRIAEPNATPVEQAIQLWLDEANSLYTNLLKESSAVGVTRAAHGGSVRQVVNESSNLKVQCSLRH